MTKIYTISEATKKIAKAHAQGFDVRVTKVGRNKFTINYISIAHPEPKFNVGDKVKTIYSDPEEFYYIKKVMWILKDGMYRYSLFGVEDNEDYDWSDESIIRLVSAKNSEPLSWWESISE